MSKTISIGDVTIPLGDFAVAGTAWLGIKKAGKTYGAKGVAEQLIDHGVPLIVFDAIGLWRFLKTPGDGHGGKGYKVVVAGGEAPDIPLTAQNASEIIRAAMRSNVSLVIDLYDPKLSKADWRKIVQTGFHTLLYENKQHGPRYVILEEAAEYIPQKVYDGETYAAVEKTVRMGGNVGLGVALLNPRSQELNKAVLDLCDNLVLLRQRGNAAIDAVQKWMDKVNPEIADEITASLPKISCGECWVWAENSETPVYTKTHKLHSFHPDRTKHGENIKARQSVDTAEFVSTLLSELPKVVEEKKANDPAELKRTITELKRKVSDLERKAPEVKQSEPIKVPVFDKEDREILTGLVEDIKNTAENLDQIKFSLGDMKSAVANLGAKANSLASSISPVVVHSHRVTRTLGGRSALKKIDRTRSAVMENGHSDTSINSTQQRILDALAWFESVGNNQPSTLQVGAVALIDSTGGYFSNMVGPLSANGLIDRGNGVMSLTDAGRKIAQVPDNISTLGDYHAMLCERVRKLKSAGGKTVEILEVIIAQGPDGEITTEEIGQLVQVDHTGGYFSNMIGPLGGLGLIERDRGIVRPTEILFPPGLA